MLQNNKWITTSTVSARDKTSGFHSKCIIISRPGCGRGDGRGRSRITDDIQWDDHRDSYSTSVCFNVTVTAALIQVLWSSMDLGCLLVSWPYQVPPSCWLLTLQACSDRHLYIHCQRACVCTRVQAVLCSVHLWAISGLTEDEGMGGGGVLPRGGGGKGCSRPALLITETPACRSQWARDESNTVCWQGRRVWQLVIEMTIEKSKWTK